MTRLAILSVALLLAACDRGPTEPRVSRAWVRLPAVAGQPGAAYFTLEGGRTDKTLTRVESAMAGRVELHESMAGMNGMTAMKPLAEIAIPARTAVMFAPGGKHAMIYAVSPAVTPGTAVPLRFGFSDGSTAEAEAKTVAAGGDAPY